MQRHTHTLPHNLQLDVRVASSSMPKCQVQTTYSTLQHASHRALHFSPLMLIGQQRLLAPHPAMHAVAGTRLLLINITSCALKIQTSCSWPFVQRHQCSCHSKRWFPNGGCPPLPPALQSRHPGNKTKTQSQSTASRLQAQGPGCPPRLSGPLQGAMNQKMPPHSGVNWEEEGDPCCVSGFFRACFGVSHITQVPAAAYTATVLS